MQVKVVELKRMDDDLEVSSLARWVLTSDGEVLIVETAPYTFDYAYEFFCRLFSGSLCHTFPYLMFGNVSAA